MSRPKSLSEIITMNGCESPIEATMLGALQLIVWPDGVEIKRQVAIGRCRVDFLLGRQRGDRADCLVVVECDGAAFHKPGDDYQRDRFLQTQGAAVLRFTGSEIERDPSKCASEVSLWMDAAIRRVDGVA